MNGRFCRRSDGPGHFRAIGSIGRRPLPSVERPITEQTGIVPPPSGAGSDCRRRPRGRRRLTSAVAARLSLRRAALRAVLRFLGAARMELFGSESNPVPEGAVAGMITTSDGVKLRFARWRPAARRSRGTVCLFQGRAEAIEKYFEVVGDLRRRGFAVATLDWRGQGGSERRLRNRRKGHVDSFAEYDRDLDAFMEQVALPDCPPPHFALAHSTGGLIASAPRTRAAPASPAWW